MNLTHHMTAGKRSPGCTGLRLPAPHLRCGATTTRAESDRTGQNVIAQDVGSNGCLLSEVTYAKSLVLL